MNVEIVTTIERLEAMAPEWAAFCARADAAPFHSPAWVIPLRRVFDEGDLLAAACREGGALVGIVAFAAGRRRVECTGVAISDYSGGLFENEYRTKVAAAILTALAARGIDTVELTRLPETSPWVGNIAGWDGAIEADEHCPVLALDSAGLEASIPARQAAKLRYYQRRAAKLGEVDFARADEATAEEFLNDLFTLHAARWSERGAAGVLGDPSVERFHRIAAPALARAGMLRLYRLRVGRRTAAVLYALASGRRVYYYLGGFDPAMKALSPGALIVGHAIAEAVREGAAEFDFLRGREAYKFAWGAEDRSTYRRTLRKTARGEAGAFDDAGAAPW